MALTSTLYNFEITLADSDRGVYESFKLPVAMHPSETLEFMATRVLAYCLEYEDGLALSKGLSDVEEPAIWNRHLDGRVKSWIEVGCPDGARLHKASKSAERVAIYTHKPQAVLLKQLAGQRIHRGDSIPIYSFDAGFLRQLAGLFERRNEVSVSVSGRQVYVEIRGSSCNSPIGEAPASS